MFDMHAHTDNRTGSPIVERALDLDLMEECGHAGKYVPSSENTLAMLHKLGHRMLAISDSLLELGSDQGDGFCLVELESSREPFLRKKPRLRRVWSRQ